MRILTASVAVAFTIATAAIASSQTAEFPQTDFPPELREAALENLLSERGELPQLEKAITAAREAGVNEQAILEACFLYHVDQFDDKAIASMLPDFLRLQKNFRLEDSAIFAVTEDWLAVVEYVKAIHALENNDNKGFKEHIKEAFWLGPRQAAAFAPHIERLRHEEAMRAITVDFNTEVNTLKDNTPRTLNAIIRDKKALLIHFWSPDSRECVASMPDFSRTATTLAGHDIAIVSLTPESSPEALATIAPYAEGNGVWATDTANEPLGRLLRIQHLPAMTLVTAEGKILFNGDPTDAQFWIALRKIDKTIPRPMADGDIDR